MARGARDVDAKPVDVCHARPRLAAYGAGVDLAPNVQGKRSVHLVGRTGANHKRGALAVLLGGLEEGADLADKFISHLGEHSERP